MPRLFSAAMNLSLSLSLLPSLLPQQLQSCLARKFSAGITIIHERWQRRHQYVERWPCVMRAMRDPHRRHGSPSRS